MPDRWRLTQGYKLTYLNDLIARMPQEKGAALDLRLPARLRVRSVPGTEVWQG